MTERIGLVSSAVPFIRGGYRFIVEWLEEQLRQRGHEVEILMVPSTGEPEALLQQMTAFRMMDLDRYFDRVITFRPPSHMVRHRRKVCWFIHHERALYDLWGSAYCPWPDSATTRAQRDTIHRADTVALREAYLLFANSAVIAHRLMHFNGLTAEVLYPPLRQNGHQFPGPLGDEIVSVCRLEPHKRPAVLVEAMRHARSAVRLRLCGAASDPNYLTELYALVQKLGLAGRVMIEPRWISEQEKADRLASSLAVAYVPFDEDSYGYPTLEAAQARRAILTASDSGGVLEFVRDGVEGLVVRPQPDALAAAFDRLHEDRGLAGRLGAAAAARVRQLGIDWDSVIDKLLA